MAKRKNVLERNKDKVLGLVLEGLSDAAVAAAMSGRRVTVSRQGVTAFRKRHVAELTAVKEEIVRQVEDFAIAQKVNRIAALDELYTRMRAEVDEYGLNVVERVIEKDVTETADGKVTEKEKITETRDFRGTLVREMRGVLRDAAEELGQLPKADINVPVSIGILVRQVRGYEGEIG